jgi:hypothetical protein
VLPDVVTDILFAGESVFVALISVIVPATDLKTFI